MRFITRHILVILLILLDMKRNEKYTENVALSCDRGTKKLIVIHPLFGISSAATETTYTFTGTRDQNNANNWLKRTLLLAVLMLLITEIGFSQGGTPASCPQATFKIILTKTDSFRFAFKYV